jgi:hypothetical protein
LVKLLGPWLAAVSSSCQLGLQPLNHTLKKGLETFFNFEKKMANFQISIAEMGFKGKTRKREEN